MKENLRSKFYYLTVVMSQWIYTEIFPTSFGDLILGSFNDQLCLCDWRYRKKRDSIDRRVQSGLSATYVEEGSEIIEETKKQLTQYFNGKRKVFELPLLMVGSSFQKKTWRLLLEIQYGKTISYASLAARMGDGKAVRAVASANGANAISIIIPCHRILGTNDRLTGYAGGLQTKKKLLQLENAFLQKEFNFREL